MRARKPLAGSHASATAQPFPVSVFSGNQPRGRKLGRLVPDLPPDEFLDVALHHVVHPLASPCPLPQRLLLCVQRCVALGEDLVSERWRRFAAIRQRAAALEPQREVWRRSLSPDQLRMYGHWHLP